MTANSFESAHAIKYTLRVTFQPSKHFTFKNCFKMLQKYIQITSTIVLLKHSDNNNNNNNINNIIIKHV